MAEGKDEISKFQLYLLMIFMLITGAANTLFLKYMDDEVINDHDMAGPLCFCLAMGATLLLVRNLKRIDNLLSFFNCDSIRVRSTLEVAFCILTTIFPFTARKAPFWLHLWYLHHWLHLDVDPSQPHVPSRH